MQAAESLPEGATVVTVFCDDNKKYLSTGLMAEEPVMDAHWTPEVELLDLRVLPRAQKVRQQPVVDARSYASK